MRIFLLLLVISLNVFAGKKDEIFKNLFYSDKIQDRYCGVNSEHLIKAWDAAGLDLSNTELWYVTSKSFGYFGLIKYFQNRWGYFKPAPYEGNPDYSANTSGGWYFHVFTVSNGLVYDFSYKTKPTIKKIEDYIMDMFVLHADVGTLSFERRGAGRDMINGYQIDAYPAQEYVERLQSRMSTNEIKFNCGFLGEFVGTGYQSCIEKN